MDQARSHPKQPNGMSHPSAAHGAAEPAANSRAKPDRSSHSATGHRRTAPRSCESRSAAGAGMSNPARVLVRMPTDLHAQITARATEQGVSVNHLIVALLAGGVGFKL